MARGTSEFCHSCSDSRMNCSTVDSGFGGSDFPLTTRDLLPNATRCVVDRATGFRCGDASFGSPGSSWWSGRLFLAVVFCRMWKTGSRTIGLALSPFARLLRCWLVAATRSCLVALVRRLPGLFLWPGRAHGSMWLRRLYPNILALVTFLVVAIPMGSFLKVVLKT